MAFRKHSRHIDPKKSNRCQEPIRSVSNTFAMVIDRRCATRWSAIESECNHDFDLTPCLVTAWRLHFVKHGRLPNECMNVTWTIVKMQGSSHQSESTRNPFPSVCVCRNRNRIPLARNVLPICGRRTAFASTQMKCREAAPIVRPRHGMFGDLYINSSTYSSSDTSSRESAGSHCRKCAVPNCISSAPTIASSFIITGCKSPVSTG